MPRIPAAREPTAPGAVVSMPRPGGSRRPARCPCRRSPRPSRPWNPLIELGSAIGEASNQVLDFVVKQEQTAEHTRIKTETARVFTELRASVEGAGTAAEARALWNEQSPKAHAQLVKFAEARGMPEVAGGIALKMQLEKAQVQSFLASRVAHEGADAAKLFTAQQVEAMAAANSAAEFTRHRAELHRELERVSQSNPLMSPGDADLLFNAAVQEAAQRRAKTAMFRAAGDAGALRGFAAAVDAGGFNLPADQMAEFSARAIEAAERAERHQQALAEAAAAKARSDLLAAGARALSDVRVATIDTRDPTQLDRHREEVEQLFADGAISPSQRVSSIAAIEAQRARLLNVDTSRGEAVAALNAGTLKSQAQADEAFEAVVEASPDFATMEPAAQLDFALSHAAQAGFLPNHVRLMITNAEHTSDPAELARGAFIEQRTRELAPNARRDPGMRVLDTIALAEQAQIPLDQAALRIHENLPDRATREERDAAFAEAFPDFDPREFLVDQGIASVHRPLFPDATAAVDAADARRAQEALQLAFRETGDPGRAQEVATRWLQRQGYGVTTLGGGEPRLMRFPPELMIPPNVPATALDAFTPDLFGTILDGDLRRQLGDLISPPRVEGVPDYALRPIPGVTERQIAAGERAEYEALVRNEDGILTPAIVTLDDGTTEFLRYRLPTLAEVQTSPEWQSLIRGEAPPEPLPLAVP